MRGQTPDTGDAMGDANVEGLWQWARGWRLALEVGIGHEREFIRFWSRLAAKPEGRSSSARSR